MLWYCIVVTFLFFDATHGQEFFAVEVNCSSNADCAPKPDSECTARTIQDGVGNVQNVFQCACRDDHGWSIKADQSRCVKQVGVHQPCIGSPRSVCVDPGSQCVHEGSLSNNMRCYCKQGYVTAHKSPGSSDYVCGVLLTDAQDSNCTKCHENDGTCYDTNNDGKRDGCMCMLSQTGDDCENVHLNVQCTGTTKSICYGPAQEGVNFTTGSKLFADGHGGDIECVGKVLTAATATANCQAGYTLLNLPLTADSRDECGTKEIAHSGNMKFDTKVSLTRTDGGATYHFNTYCTFQQQMDSVFKGVAVMARSMGHEIAATGNDRGQHLKPKLTLRVEDGNRNVLGAHPKVRSGTEVKFFLELSVTDPVIYSAIKVDHCMFSTDGSVNLDMNGISDVNSKTVISNGCPAAEQSWVTSDTNFNLGPMKKRNILETGLIPLRKFPSSNMLYLHCTVNLCTPSDLSKCGESTCGGPKPGFGRRKRATEVEDGNSAEVEMALQFVDNDSGTPAKNTADAAGGSASIGGGTMIGMIVIMIAVLVAFVVIALFMLHRVKNRDAKVMDHQPGKPQNFALPRMERNQNI